MYQTDMHEGMLAETVPITGTNGEGRVKSPRIRWPGDTADSSLSPAALNMGAWLTQTNG
jgi:hypothetical protein